MKPIYATLDGYNQYQQETRDSVLLCPELSDEDNDNETFILPKYVETDLEGTAFDPIIVTKASGSAFGVIEKDGIFLVVKVRQLHGPVHCGLYRVEDGSIGELIVTLYQSSKNTRKRISGNLVSTFVSFSKFDIRHLLDDEEVALVVSTYTYPDGEISGFLRKIFPLGEHGIQSIKTK